MKEKTAVQRETGGKREFEYEPEDDFLKSDALKACPEQAIPVMSKRQRVEGW
jgi:hypothetical protein